jgi:flagellar hook assembly protein FlgD
MIIDKLINYPNPFTAGTRITAGINRPGEELEVTLKIYTSGGRLIKIMNLQRYVTGYQLPDIEWDGTCEDGSRAGRGVYPYLITIKTTTGETSSGSGTMIILK